MVRDAVAEAEGVAKERYRDRSRREAEVLLEVAQSNEKDESDGPEHDRQ